MIASLLLWRARRLCLAMFILRARRFQTAGLGGILVRGDEVRETNPTENEAEDMRLAGIGRLNCSKASRVLERKVWYRV
jgi:hypothetical protein